VLAELLRVEIEASLEFCTFGGWVME
jgi:hypothetical protein